jgi:hypothetical protein
MKKQGVWFAGALYAPAPGSATGPVGALVGRNTRPVADLTGWPGVLCYVAQNGQQESARKTQGIRNRRVEMYAATLLRAALVSAAMMGVAVAAEPGKPETNPATPASASPPASPPPPAAEISVAIATEAPARAQHTPSSVKIYPCF